MIIETVFNIIAYGYFLPMFLSLLLHTIISYIDSDLVSFDDILFSIIPIANLIFVILDILCLFVIIATIIFSKIYNMIN